MSRLSSTAVSMDRYEKPDTSGTVTDGHYRRFTVTTFPGTIRPRTVMFKWTSLDDLIWLINHEKERFGW